MQRIFSFTFLVLISSFSFVSAQESKLTVKQLDIDLLYLDSIFSKIHPVNFPTYSKRHLDDFRKTIQIEFKNREISNFEYNVAVRSAIDSFSCVHTYITKNPLRPKVEQNFFDEKFFAADGKLFFYPKINQRVRLNDSVLEIVSINSVASEIILKKMLVHHCPDGRSEAFGYKCANLVGAFYIASVLNRPDIYRLELKTAQNEIQIIEVKGSEKSSNQIFKTPMPVFTILDTKNYKFTYLQDTIGFLKINDFEGKYKANYKRIFSYLEKDNCQNLIIDVRENLGGTRSNGMELLSYLCKDEVIYEVWRPEIEYCKYFDRKGKRRLFLSRLYYNSGHLFSRERIKNAMVFTFSKKSKTDVFRGKIYVLVDGFSSSTSVLVASILKDRGAIIIGQQTGGGEAGNFGGTFQTLLLPESKVEINFPLLLLKYGVKSKNFSGIKPDIVVKNNPQNRGKLDEELETVIKLITEK